MTSYTPKSVFNFSISFGVNCHIAETPYDDYTNFLAAWKYTLIPGIRTQAPDSFQSWSVNQKSNMLSLVGTGNAPRWDIILDGRGNDVTGDSLNTKMKWLSGTFQTNSPAPIWVCMEGPNEINNNVAAWAGYPAAVPSPALAWATLGYQNSMARVVKADINLGPVLTNKIADLTGAAELIDGGTTRTPPDWQSWQFGNAHVYPGSGTSLQSNYPGIASGWYNPAIALSQMMFTEFGWRTSSTGPGDTNFVDQNTQAKQILNGFVSAYAAGGPTGVGVPFSCVYALSDDSAAAGDSWGLFEFPTPGVAWTPKVSATAIRSLLHILSNAAGSFTGSTQNITMSGQTSTTQLQSLFKNDGTYAAVVWDAPTMWNPTTQMPVTVTPNNVTVTLPGSSYTTINWYDPMLGFAVQGSNPGGNSIVVPISDHPIVILYKA